MQNQVKILLFGSGLMADSVVKYLLKRPQNHVHIASNIIEDAKKIALNYAQGRCSYSAVDVTDPQVVDALVQNHHIAISYVPAFLHVHIAKSCLRNSKNLVTASYVSPEMQALDEEAKSKNLIFLNQLGLDPGIDHLATMKIVHQTEKQGAKILEYESWCGGLPSPDSCDNPIGYKFTWSPIGALRALKNKATFIRNSNTEEIQSKDLQYYGAEIELNQALTFEGYPNRNSVAYKEIYGLHDATKVLRGTLRYRGFCTVINAWKEIKLMQEDPVTGNTWVQQLTNLLDGQEGSNLQQKIWSRCFKKVSHYDKLSEQEKLKKFSHTIRAFKYFELLNPATQINDANKNRLQNLVNLMEKKLSLKQGETDLIAMQHIFLIQRGDKKIIKKSSMVQIGDKKGASAMSVTVGTPTAIGAQMILDGKVSERGVLIPKYEDIYNPVLKKLAEEGIKLIEVQEEL